MFCQKSVKTYITSIINSAVEFNIQNVLNNIYVKIRTLTVTINKQQTNSNKMKNKICFT